MDEPVAMTDGWGPWRAGTDTGFEPFPDAAVAATITERLTAMWERHGTSTAISSPAGTWTYAELRRDVERTAAAVGALVDDDRPRPVALLATHDGPLVVTLLSVIAAGHIVVILDPASPADQIASVIAEARPPLLLHDDANAATAASLAPAGATVLGLDELGAHPAAAEPGTFPQRRVDDAVMLAFTSGTSGTPKGAVITHGVLLNLVRGATNALGIGPDDRMPMLFPTSLAVAAYPMFLPLLNGGTLATLDVRSVGLEPVPSFLADQRISVAYMAPTVVRFLVDALDGWSFPDLRLLALGGEVVDREVVDLTRKLFAPDQIANGYGTTETGVITLQVFDAHAPVDGAVPVGFAVPDVDLFVLDEAGRPLPVGEPGEVAVATPFMFAGYWGHPELTRQALAADPVGRDGWYLYRTGDHGTLDAEGRLVVAGRVDTKVKVRGRFVVLGDVEALLHEQPEVADAVVTSRAIGGVVELVGYVVPVDAASFDPVALRTRLLDAHDAYRVPSRWVVLDELPRLPNGKTDRRSLPPIEVVGGAAPSATGAAFGVHSGDRDTLRRTIRDLWEWLLPTDVVGVDDDFFALGGDSLLAAQMLIEVERRLGVIVPMGELIHARTVRSLTEVVERLRSDAGSPRAVACVQSGDEAARPRLWFVPDLQGSAYRVRHLAAALGPDQPVWSFESPLMAGEANRFGSLREFVAEMVDHVLEAQPEGPYWLAGYSFGGICAYEMGTQLRARGRDVVFVGVVDVGPGYRGPGWNARQSPNRPWFGVAKPPPAGASFAEQVRHYREMWSTSRSGAARHAMVRSGLARVVDPLRFAADLRRDGRVRPEWRLWYAWEEHWKLAAQAWDRASRATGRVHLFWEDHTGSTDATMGWGGLVDDLVVIRFTTGDGGDHDAILEPAGAAGLGVALRRAIDEQLDS